MLLLNRAEESAETIQQSLTDAQQRLDDMAAENRVLLESARSMRQECNEAWVGAHPLISFPFPSRCPPIVFAIAFPLPSHRLSIVFVFLLHFLSVSCPYPLPPAPLTFLARN